MVLQQSEDM